MKDNFDLSLLENLYRQVVSAVPIVLKFIVFLVVAYLILKVVLFILKKLFRLSRIDRLADPLNNSDMFAGSKFKIVPSNILITLIKWMIILIFIIIGTEMFGLTIISNEVSKWVSYMPSFFAALVILILGVYLATLAKNGVQGFFKSLEMSGSKLVGMLVFWVITVFVGITALSQAGINTTLITGNLTLIFGGILLAFVLAIGLGSKDVVYRLILGYYSKRNFQVGQRIIIDGKHGKIAKIDSIYFTVEIDGQKVVYPIKDIADKEITIYSSE